jgi:hypothetical protein
MRVVTCPPQPPVTLRSIFSWAEAAGWGTEATRSTAESTQWQILGYARGQTATAGYGFSDSLYHVQHGFEFGPPKSLERGYECKNSVVEKPQLHLLNSIHADPEWTRVWRVSLSCFPARYARWRGALPLCL